MGPRGAHRGAPRGLPTRGQAAFGHRARAGRLPRRADLLAPQRRPRLRPARALRRAQLHPPHQARHRTRPVPGRGGAGAAARDDLQGRLGTARRRCRGGRAPRVAAERELVEEIGLDVRLGQPLITDWMPPYLGWDDAVEFIFDGGVLDAATVATLVPSDREIRAVHWVEQGDVASHVTELSARRIAFMLAGGRGYTEAGHPTPSRSAHRPVGRGGAARHPSRAPGTAPGRPGRAWRWPAAAAHGCGRSAADPGRTCGSRSTSGCAWRARSAATPWEQLVARGGPHGPVERDIAIDEAREVVLLGRREHVSEGLPQGRDQLRVGLPDRPGHGQRLQRRAQLVCVARPVDRNLGHEAPRRGICMTMPSWVRRRRASRTGAWLTESWRAISDSTNLLPGGLSLASNSRRNRS
nr:NUDIX hydrolase [Tessaracoccus coleopterorum]